LQGYGLLPILKLIPLFILYRHSKLTMNFEHLVLIWVDGLVDAHGISVVVSIYQDYGN
jgi:hypothetical protein